MLWLKNGKYCTNIYFSQQSLFKWTTLNFRRPLQLFTKMKLHSRRLFIHGLAIPVVCASNKRQGDKIKAVRSPIIPAAQENIGIVIKLFLVIYETCRILIRLAKIIFMFSSIVILYMIPFKGHIFDSIMEDLLLYVIESNGPIFVKLGQYASTRRDLFSEATCKLLSKLQRHVKPHCWSYTKYCMEQSFGNKWSEIFHFANNQKPVGSGCVAQVYKAEMSLDASQKAGFFTAIRQKISQNEAPTLVENALDILEVENIPGFELLMYLCGKVVKSKSSEISEESKANNVNMMQSHDIIPVAVKILHPGMETLFRRDIKIFHGLAWCASFLCPSIKWLSLSNCVSEFEKIMLAQLDLETEAQNLETFAENFANEPSIKFPRPIRPFISKEVLVETFEEGREMSQFLRKDENRKLQSRIARIGVDALLKMIFKDNFVHADLHPGNIIVQNADEPVSSGFNRITRPLRLCIIDCGLSSWLAKEDLMKFEALFKEVAFGDGSAVGELFLSKSEHYCSDPDKFKSEMNELVTEAKNGALSLDKVDVGHLLQRVSLLLMKHRIRLEAAFSSTILAVFVLEGLGRSLDKDLDILERAQPFLKI